jgi:adenylate kinase
MFSASRNSSAISAIAACRSIFNPPHKEGICDSCGSKIIQRADDKEETVMERLKTYHDQTEPLISYYRNQGKLLTVIGQEKVEATSNDVLKAVRERII